MSRRPWSLDGLEMMEDFGCADRRCSTCWLFDGAGPADPAWIARVRAELAAAPSLVGRRPPRGGLIYVKNWIKEKAS